MIEQIISNILTVEMFVGFTVAILGGMLIGALPGLTATMGIALMIPVTYSMSPVAAMSMIAVLYTSAVYGGSFTAILIHTPGTPSSAATAIDGYQMTLQGKGLQALGIATTSSVFGGVVSAIALMTIAPPLAMFSLRFGPPEYFLLGIFGLTVIASLSTGNVLKGLLSGVLGLSLSVIGMDSDAGVLRYTFGNTYLFDGFNNVAAMIGLFSFAQVLSNVEDYKTATKKRFENTNILLEGSMLPSWAMLKRLFFPTMIVSSIVGLFVGILPGAGGDIGGWMAYNEAKRTAKNKDEFGKGAPEGVCAPETANNAVTGGALIPLLTLGIPGSAPAAVTLGALMIHGLRPGFSLFAEHGPTIYTMMVVFLIGNILMGVVGVLIGRSMVRICNIQNCLLTPIIVSLSCVGSYAIQNSLFDVYVMLGFGILGYIMRKVNIPAAPMVLGMLLGEMVEQSYVRTIGISKGASVLMMFLTRPICQVLIVLTVLSLLYTPALAFYAKMKKSTSR